jgi:hypothetical protein
MTSQARAWINPPAADRLAICLLVLTGVGLLFFWMLFFTVGLAPEPAPAGYFQYEHAFVVPDLLVASTMLCAAYLRRRGHPLGFLLTVAAAGSLVFLGLLDACFNWQNGVYGLSIQELVSNGLLNAYCVAVGLVLIVRAQAAFKPEYVHG